MKFLLSGGRSFVSPNILVEELKHPGLPESECGKLEPRAALTVVSGRVTSNSHPRVAAEQRWVVTQVVESQLPGSANPRELIVRTLTGSNRLARFSSQLS